MTTPDMPLKSDLFIATRERQFHMVKQLMEAYLFHREAIDEASALYVTHDDLCYALGMSKSYDIDKLLVSKGFIDHMFSWANNPMVIAIGEHDFRKTRWLLLRGALVDVRHIAVLFEKTGEYMLHYQDETNDIAMMMIDKIANLNKEISKGLTVLDLVSQRSHCNEALQFLIKRGVRLNEPGVGCRALLNTYGETTCILLEGGANPNTRLPKVGRAFKRFIEYAVHQSGDLEKSMRKVFLLYLQKGVNLTVEDFSKADRKVNLLVFLEKPSDIQMVMDELVRRGENIAVFLGKPDGNGLTPLNHALLERNNPKVDLLLSNMGKTLAGR